MTALIKPVENAIKSKDYKTAFALMEEVKVKMPMMKGSMDAMKFKVLLDTNEGEALAFGKSWLAENKNASVIYPG